MVDTVCWMRDRPITVYSSAATIQILKEHLFNWKIWPDFSEIPNGDQMCMVYREISVGETLDFNGRKVTAIPAIHTVPAVGYLLDSGEATMIFSGDTTTNDALWDIANRAKNLKYLIIETAFPNKEREIAIASKHLCPSMLAEELAKLTRPVEVFVTHLKPGEIHLTMSEIGRNAGKWRPRMLENGMEMTI
jgi:cAMP phosphodiesterase